MQACKTQLDELIPAKENRIREAEDVVAKCRQDISAFTASYAEVNKQYKALTESLKFESKSAANAYKSVLKNTLRAMQTALAMNGKKISSRKGDFSEFADVCDITRPTAEKMIRNLVKLTSKWIVMCGNSLLPNELKDRLKKIITERAEVLKQ